MSQLVPLHTLLLNQFMPILEEHRNLLENESGAHRKTLALLQSIKQGEVLLSNVNVTDDGWQIMPPPPSDEEDNHDGDD